MLRKTMDGRAPAQLPVLVEQNTFSQTRVATLTLQQSLAHSHQQQACRGLKHSALDNIRRT
jgi:hypothetical protein